MGPHHVTNDETNTKRRRTEGVDAAIAATPTASGRPERSPATAAKPSAPLPPPSTPWRSTPPTPIPPPSHWPWPHGGYPNWHHWAANGYGASGVPHNGRLASSTDLGETTIYTPSFPYSGISASDAFANDPSSSSVFVRIKEEQVQYAESSPGQWRLNCKVSPIPPHLTPPGMTFTGYWWDFERNPYAHFRAKTGRGGAIATARAGASTRRFLEISTELRDECADWPWLPQL